jgi:hypothetical protein
MVHHLVTASNVDDLALSIADSSGATKGQVLDSPHLLLGPPARMIETLIARRERLGLSYVVFRGVHLEDVAPVVAQLAGT